MQQEVNSVNQEPVPRHRFIVFIENEKQWYAVMSECRTWFGKNWNGQRHIRKKLTNWKFKHKSNLPVWFEVPDPRWATWVSTKLAVQVMSDNKMKATK